MTKLDSSDLLIPDYHSFLSNSIERVEKGEFGKSDLAHIFDAGCKNPMFFALRSRNTGWIRLVEFNRDGTVFDPFSRYGSKSNLLTSLKHF